MEPDTSHRGGVDAPDITFLRFMTEASKGQPMQLFALVAWPHRADSEHSRRFDITLTDGVRAWVAHGCCTRHNAHALTEEAAWSRAREALGGSSGSAALQYSYWTTPNCCAETPAELQLWWSWEVGELAGREVMGATPALRRAHDDVHVVQHCMASMLESLTALKADLLTSREAESVLRASAVQKEAALLELVFSRQQQEDELFVKFSLLHEQKIKLIHNLQEQLQQQQRQLDQLQGKSQVALEAEQAVYDASTDPDSDGRERRLLMLSSPHSRERSGSSRERSGSSRGSPSLRSQSHVNSPATAAAAAGHQVAAPIDVDAPTQMLDAAQLCSMQQEHQQRDKLQ